MIKASLPICMVGVLLWMSACQTTTVAAVRRTVDMSYIEQRAQELASQPYDEDSGEVPDFLEELDYDAYRDIRFNPMKALWSDEGLPFRVEFFHPGGLHTRSVRINEFTSTHEQEIRFVPDFFDYGKNEDLGRRVPSSLGYAGFRIRYPINKVDVYDEVAVFLGASYFRVIGRDQMYGLSARGLALNTGLDKPEEFPRFREFWLGKPGPNARSITVYALLDSESVTGAYQFVIKPGATTTVDVEATLFFRKPVERVGLTPFSSMYYYGENTVRKPADFRPEVHDSDGVLLKPKQGPVVWRPLTNPQGTRTSIFDAGALEGYGLMQRDRSFESYQDIEAAYHRRPSAWVTPEEMPPGKVTLYEFGTPGEVDDNVVLFYEPDQDLPVSEPVRISYQLAFDGKARSPSGYVKATRLGESPWRENTYEMVVDFAGEELADLAEVEPVELELEVSGAASADEVVTRKNTYNNTWRSVIYLRRTGDGPVELTGHLKAGDRRLTENWSYQWVD